MTNSSVLREAEAAHGMFTAHLLSIGPCPCYSGRHGCESKSPVFASASEAREWLKGRGGIVNRII